MLDTISILIFPTNIFVTRAISAISVSVMLFNDRPSSMSQRKVISTMPSSWF